VSAASRTAPVVGVVGGGQLARMTYQAAIALGVTVRVLADSSQDSAAVVAHDVTVGDYRDLDTLRRFASGCHVVTFDHEHVPTEHLVALEAAGVQVHPRPAALVHAQDKLVMRERLSAAGVPCPRWRAVDDVTQVLSFADEVGWPVVLKTPRGGYDGKGVWMLRGPADAEETLAELSSAAETTGPWLVEEAVAFRRELAVIVARSPHGQAVAYPCVETVQADGICREVLAPAPGLDDDEALQAQEVALKIAGDLDVTGVMAVEMFDTGPVAEGGHGVVVNELAMRPHNSGHWTIDGAVTSQFEQHLRAVLDLPLGSPAPVAPFTVMANVLGGDPEVDPELADLHRALLHCLARDPGLRVHFYGKEVRRGRKIGHVNVLGTRMDGSDLDELRDRANHAAAYISGEIDE
jgi:5-(carboxyamino)imidazole ribonucleotide synthase